MKGMIRQELKNYFKNPLYWVGILFILYGLFQILSPYLDVHYFHSKQEVQQTKPESLADADIMDGYVKSTEKDTEYDCQRIWRGCGKCAGDAKGNSGIREVRI